jgi:hypothetical protein
MTDGYGRKSISCLDTSRGLEVGSSSHDVAKVPLGSSNDL